MECSMEICRTLTPVFNVRWHCCCEISSRLAMLSTAVRFPFSLFVSFLSLAIIAPGEVPHPTYSQTVDQSLELIDRNQCLQAQTVLEQAIATAVRENKRDWQATMLSLLGSCYERTGRYADAEDTI